jgi:hypothetical protein
MDREHPSPPLVAEVHRHIHEGVDRSSGLHFGDLLERQAFLWPASSSVMSRPILEHHQDVEAVIPLACL